MRPAHHVTLAVAISWPSLAFAQDAGAPETEPPAAAPEPPPVAPTPPPEPPPPAPPPRASPRTEIAGVPIVAGNSDIGLQIGGGGFLTRIADGELPYRWKTDLIVSVSIKPRPGGESGYDIAQQAHDIRFDIPRFLGSNLRVMPGLFVERHVNAGYFGLGNAAPALPMSDGTFGRRYQSITEEVRGRLNVRFPLYGRLDGMVGIQVRYTNATAYGYSKLEADSRVIEPDGSPRIRGLNPIAAAIPAVGVVYDTRDNEISPRSGAFDIYGLRFAAGAPTSEGILYGGGSAVLRRYKRLPGPFTLAGRFVGDFIVGHAPFYDLAQGVTFTPVDLIGGQGGLRGVPNGRYTGKIKMLASLELRALITTFGFLGQSFRFGAQTFVDVGRIWADFKYDPVRDGRGVGLKYGVGGGFYIIWGEAAVIRIEAAFSPDAVSANPGFPIGLYAADSHAF